jgi:hypothetical protein
MRKEEEGGGEGMRKEGKRRGEEGRRMWEGCG